MKLINLILESADNKKINYDFQNKANGCITPQDINAEVYKNSLSFAFYGVIDPAEFFVKLPAKVELRFSVAEEDYHLVRKATPQLGGDVLESAKLYAMDGKEIASEKATVNALCLEIVGLKKKAFEKLIIVDREITAALAEDKLTRETVIADQLARLTTSKEVYENITKLKEKEKNLVQQIEAIVPVSRNEFEEQSQIVQADKQALESVRRDIEEVRRELALATAYQDSLDQHIQSQSDLEELIAKKESQKEQKEKLELSNKAKEVLSGFTAYEDFINNIQQKRVEYEKIKDSMKSISKKIDDGEASIDNLSEQFIVESRRVEELEKVLNEHILGSAEGPKELGLKKIVDSYYTKYDASVSDLVERQKEVEKEFAVLNAELSELHARRSEISLTPTYKIAVEDGAVIKGSMERIISDIAASEQRIERLSREKSDLISSNANNVETINKIKARLNFLNKEICSSYPTQKDAFNASVYINQNLYAKHLLATILEKEIDQIAQKIEKVSQSAKVYADKLLNLRNKRTEIVNHREKLLQRLNLLNEKMTEYMSYNRLREITKEVEYGSHCPVCDGFVAIKRDLPLRDTKALDDQIKAVEAELEKDTKAVIEAENTLGQYEAAVTVSSQYLDSLTSSLEIKQSQVSKILEEFKQDSVQALADLMEKELNKSKKLMNQSDEFKKLEAELREREARHNQIQDRVKLIDNEDLPFERVVLADLMDKHTREKVQYDETVKLLKGESAIEALKKIQIIDKEIFQIDADIHAKSNKLISISIERDELFRKIHDVRARVLPLNYKGEEYTYIQVVAQAFSKHLAAITAEIDKAQEKRNNLKIRIKAVKKVLDDLREQTKDDDEALLVLDTTIKAEEEMINDFFPGFEDELDKLGVNSRAGLEELVIPDQEAINIETALNDNDIAIIRTEEAIKVHQRNFSENERYFGKMDRNIRLLNELLEREEEAIVALGASMSKNEEYKYRYNSLIENNQLLSIVQSRIKGIEDLSRAIKDGAIISKELADLIYSRAVANVENMTNGKYSLDFNEESGIVVTMGAKKLTADKLPKTDLLMFELAIAYAYHDVLVSLLGGRVVFAVNITEEESNRISLKYLVEFSQSNDIVVVPEDEALYFKAVSKI